MARLILLRHGKTESVSATGADFERGLTDRGRRDAALMGQVLSQAGVTPDLVLVSAARRAQETWDEAAPSFPAARAQTVRALYLASPEQLAAQAAAAAPGVSVMLVGHNPGIQEYALQLLAATPGAPDATLVGLDNFPTAAAAVFRLDDAGKAHFERLFLPREHGGGPA
jgi:phosphohistidine phosphatase